MNENYSPNQPAGATTFRWKWLIVLLALIILGVGLAYAFNLFPSLNLGTTTDHMKNNSDPYRNLMESNEAFQKGEAALRAGKEAEAAALFKEALAQATEKAEVGQIKYKIAIAETRHDPADAIRHLKEIVADSEQAPLQKAYAIQHMGNIFAKNTNQNTAELIFEGEGYAEMYAEKDVLLAMRRLLEYGSSFYPLALSELRIAKWYAVELGKLDEPTTLSEEERIKYDVYVGVIREKLRNADTDLERTRKTENAQSLIPEILVRRAELLALVYLAGDETFPNPEEAFREAIVATAPVRGDGAPRVAYAGYLAQKYGEERAKDINDLLLDVYNNIDYYPQGLRVYLANEKNNIVGMKHQLVLISEIVSEFRSMLIHLGWDEADFAF